MLHCLLIRLRIFKVKENVLIVSELEPSLRAQASHIETRANIIIPDSSHHSVYNL